MTPDGFVIWTRLAPHPLETRGDMPKENIAVGWEVSADDSFQKIRAHKTSAWFVVPATSGPAGPVRSLRDGRASPAAVIW
jgi:hypothetical protein